MTGVSAIRKTFLDYFQKNGHEVVRSAPLTPLNDPTLMFTAAGMVPFKNVFTGQETRPYTRATSAQKCLRAGGKHNDLENVGYTARHHTFFEMMGNFSFGDYFRDDAINFAWELLTKEFGMDKDRLIITVYHTDDEAVKIWKKVAGISDDKIIRIATSDNFWSAGETGPCGPSTEIFYDHGAHIQGGLPGTPEEDGDRFVEIWNLVFMQYDQISKDKRVDLPKPSIDTGGGLERFAAVLQGTHDNYATDLVRSLIDASAHATNTDPDGKQKVSHRVIADHLRAACFMMADGILPSNEGRGYVLRRIMRRAMRHAHLLGAQDPLMHSLVPSLIAQMGDTYPELKESEALATETLRREETRFKTTLDKGLTLLEAETAKLDDTSALSGDVAFKLYDTFGFPLDLTQDVLRREQNREVDTAGFETAMDKQRAAARAAWSGSGDAATEQVWFDIKEKHGVTEFLGYTQEEADGIVLSIVNDKGTVCTDAKEGDTVTIITNQTPFYGESGGQAGDTGLLTTDTAAITVTNTLKKLGSLTVHIGKVSKGSIAVNDTVHMKIDTARRNDIRANHSATHLLHAALREEMGKHVTQKGSLVTADRLRFDISQPDALTDAQILAVEQAVNAQIRANTSVTTRLMPIDDAREAGAMAMFGEKYDDEVRVLGMGTIGDNNIPFSMELCGGTHVTRTGDIGLIKITSESALASGVRRIEAVTGRGALEYLNQQEQRLRDIAHALKSSTAEAPARVTALVSDKKKMDKELTDLRRKLAAGGGTSNGEDEAKVIKGVKFASRVLEGMSPGDLKPLADEMKAKLGSGIVTLVSVAEDGKGSVVIGVTKDLTEKYSAVDLVRKAAAVLGGKGGGGRPDMAQAGGPEGEKAEAVILEIEKTVAAL